MRLFAIRFDLLRIVDRIAMIREKHVILEQNRYETLKFKSTIITKEEKNRIKSKWDVLHSKYSINSFKVFKSICGFNPDFVPDELFQPLISSSLNPYVYRSYLSDKGHYPSLFSSIKQPKTHLRVFDDKIYFHGELLDRGLINEAYNAIGKCFVKPAVESCQGYGCKFIDTKSVSLDSLMKQYNNFVIQSPLEQSDKTSFFNPSSLNCFRVTSININGRITAPTVCLKFGQNGSIVDNVGSGGYIVGVDVQSGHLRPNAYDSQLGTISMINGIPLNDIVFSEVSSLISFAIKNHSEFFSELGIVGWDLALDSHNQPVMIEANTGDAINYVGIHLEQLATATPIFGERTDEVIDYVCSHPARFLY